MLQIKDIHKEYRTGNLVQRALDGVSLSLRDNEFVAILGPSGSGKTTLLNIIGGLDRYDSGDLIINGISTRKYKDRDWDSYRNHTIGFVFQSYNLIPDLSVYENIVLPIELDGGYVDKAYIEELLRQLKIEDKRDALPGTLSGGQQQRTAIARALSYKPAILLADEPTGNLDTQTSHDVMGLLKTVARKYQQTTILITHDMDVAQLSDRIVYMEDGKIRKERKLYA